MFSHWGKNKRGKQASILAHMVTLMCYLYLEMFAEITQKQRETLQLLEQGR